MSPNDAALSVPLTSVGINQRCFALAACSVGDARTSFVAGICASDCVVLSCRQPTLIQPARVVAALIASVRFTEIAATS